MQITDLEIAAAQDQADAAAAELAAEERRIGPGKVAEDVAARLAVLLVRARQAVTVVEDLRARQAAQREELAARDAREELAAGTLARLREELSTAKARLVAAAAAHQASGTELADAAAAYDTQVAGGIDELNGLDLRLTPHVDHANGADRAVVRVAGEYWHRLDAAAVVAWTDARVALSRWGVGNNFAVTLRSRPGVRDIDLHGLLAGVPDLPPAPAEPRVRPASVPRDTPPAGPGKPFLAQDRPREPTAGWEDRWRRQYPGVPVPGDAA